MKKKNSAKFREKNHSFSEKIYKELYLIDSGLASVPVEEIANVSLGNLEDVVKEFDNGEEGKVKFLFEKQKQIFDVLEKHHPEAYKYFSKDFYSQEHREKFLGIVKKYDLENGIDYAEIYGSLGVASSMLLKNIEKILGGSTPEDAERKLKSYKNFEKSLQKGFNFYSKANHMIYEELKEKFSKIKCNSDFRKFAEDYKESERKNKGQ